MSADSLAPLALAVENYHGKFCVAELYRDAIIAPIIDRQELNIDAAEILVLLDDNSGSIADRCVRVSLMPEMMGDVLFQLTGRRYKILLRLSQSYMTRLEPSRIAYYVYDALRHIERHAENPDKYVFVREHDVCVWREVLPYAAGIRVLPDVSEVRIFGEVGAGAD